MRLNSMLATVLIFLCSLVISSCSNDELAPISLKNRETANIKLNYPNNQTYSFPLQGGDGNYEISCDKPEIIETPPQGEAIYKADPYANEAQLRPDNASIITDLTGFHWTDKSWVRKEEKGNHLESPMAIYECHLGS